MNGSRLNWGMILLNDLPEYQPLEEPILFKGKGGWSGATFWNWTSPKGRILMKVWPVDGPSEKHHLCRHKRLEGLKSLSLPLALPIPDRYGRTLRRWQSQSWAELIPWIDGTPAWDDPSDDKMAHVAGLLSEFHGRWLSFGPRYQNRSEAVISRLGQLHKLAQMKDHDFCSSQQLRIGQSQSTFQLLHEIVRLSKELVQKAIAWLGPFETHAFRIQTVLRDARPDQFLFNDEYPSGVIDFGAVGSDSVALDLARLTSEWFPNDALRTDQFIRYYESHHRITNLERDAIRPLSLAGAILGGLAWLDLHFVKKRTIGRDEEFQNALQHALLRLQPFADKNSY